MRMERTRRIRLLVRLRFQFLDASNMSGTLQAHFSWRTRVTRQKTKFSQIRKATQIQTDLCFTVVWTVPPERCTKSPQLQSWCYAANWASDAETNRSQ